mmetsp:Transcript_15461/g.39893  ORF Transcript_15461/g.39893 Transcript_15461/m.39893 type:complete len:222 (+) Transcript_15461:1260-1925(+)
MEEELSAIAVVHDKVELLRRLEGKLEVHQVRVVCALERLALRLRVRHLVALEQSCLGERLHGVNLLILLVSHEHDLAEGALAEHADDCEVVHAVLRLARERTARHHGGCRSRLLGRLALRVGGKLTYLVVTLGVLAVVVEPAALRGHALANRRACHRIQSHLPRLARHQPHAPRAAHLFDGNLGHHLLSESVHVRHVGDGQLGASHIGEGVLEHLHRLLPE